MKKLKEFINRFMEKREPISPITSDGFSEVNEDCDQSEVSDDTILSIDNETDEENTCKDNISDEIAKDEDSIVLLDNIPCITMVECCCQILDYLECQEKYGASDLKETHSYIEQLFFEYIVRIGGELIIDDTQFNPVRHISSDRSFINPGAPIKIVSSGVRISDKVYIKAKVKPLEQNIFK